MEQQFKRTNDVGLAGKWFAVISYPAQEQYLINLNKKGQEIAMLEMVE